MDELERGREAYCQRAWLTAYKALSLADEAIPLGAEDLELLATSAYLIGRNDDGVCALDRAYHVYLDAGEPVCAARCAVWLGFGLMDAGEISRASGWFSRGQRLLERTEGDCVERGYLLVPVVLQQMSPGGYETGYATAAVVAEIGERFGDVDLISFALQAQGRALVRLLQLAQGRTDAAAAAICRVVGETTERLERARLLPAYVEIMLVVGERTQARDACRELAEIAEGYGRDGVLGAMAAHAQGAVELAEGDARAALIALRRACQVWQQLGAPYEVAVVRVLVGLACRALGDDDGSRSELEAARGVFLQLRAGPDVARLDSLIRDARSCQSGGLTPRELQVLRLVTAGATNKAIAAELVLSGRTVDRHVSNILTKLAVPSRAAATAYAYQHRLV